MGVVMTNLEKRVLEALKKEGQATAPLLAEKVGTTPESVRTTLTRLVKLGLVKRVARGLYEVEEGSY
jgi:DNA-binding Lrp family transcriptional regulator